jgi:DNA-binding transcriptional MerR regulator
MARQPTIGSTIAFQVERPMRAIQLFDPPADAVYTIDTTAHLVDVPRRAILVYCKHRLLSPLISARNGAYLFDRDAIRALRRVEALRTICGDDLAGIRIILDLTKQLERLQSDLRRLSQTNWRHEPRNKSARKTQTNAPRTMKPKFNQQKRRI